jgi:hypothetical protein
MGTQQLLLIVLCVVLVGIALSIGLSLFQANIVEASRDAIIEDLLFLAGKARDYYLRPAMLGGGNRDFSGVTIQMLTARPENENARYFVVKADPNILEIGGRGRIVVSEDTIEVHLSIDEATNTIKIIH